MTIIPQIKPLPGPGNPTAARINSPQAASRPPLVSGGYGHLNQKVPRLNRKNPLHGRLRLDLVLGVINSRDMPPREGRALSPAYLMLRPNVRQVEGGHHRRLEA